MGYINEFPHGRMWDSDLREILELFEKVIGDPTAWDNFKEEMLKLYDDFKTATNAEINLFKNEINLKISGFETELNALKADNALMRHDITELEKLINDIKTFVEDYFKNLDFHTFEDYGAVGDGITDDTVAIQKAINAGHENYFMLNKTYIVSAPIFLTRGNVTITGKGLNSIIKLKDNCSPKPWSIFAAENTESRVSNIRLTNFVIDGNRINNVDHGEPDSDGNQSKYWVGTLLALINFTNVDNAIIEDMRLINSWGSAIWLNDCRNCRVQNNTLTDYRITGIALRNNTDYSITETVSNIIDSNICSGGVIGIDCLFGAYSNSITNNVCYNNRDSNRFPSYAYYGYYPNVYPIASGFKSPTDDGYINPAYEGDGAGIENTGFYTSSEASHTITNVIANNNCHNNMCGIRLEEETQDCSITGNICSFNDQIGILIFSSNFMSVVGNTCNNNGLHGIALHKLYDGVKDDARVQRLVPNNNTISGNTMSANGEFGLSLSGCRYNSIDGNIISGNNTKNTSVGGGIRLEAINDNVVEPAVIYPVEYNIFSNNVLTNYSGNDKCGFYGVENGVPIGTANIIKDNMISMPVEFSHIPRTNNIQNIKENVPKTLLELTNIPSGASYRPEYTYYSVINGVCYLQLQAGATEPITNWYPIAAGILPKSALGNYFYVYDSLYSLRIDENGVVRLNIHEAITNITINVAYPIATN